jgi:hypothetical protein
MSVGAEVGCCTDYVECRTAMLNNYRSMFVQGCNLFRLLVSDDKDVRAYPMSRFGASDICATPNTMIGSTTYQLGLKYR